MFRREMMKSKILVSVIVSVFSGLLCSAAIAGQGGGEEYAFNLKGAGNMYPDTVPDIDGDGVDDPAICFDTDLIDLKNNRVVGTATDCLSEITPIGSGLGLIGTTYFRMPEGTLITRGKTTVQPVLHQTVSATGQEFTHITGAAGSGNAIIGGDGKFASSTGTSRLSGMVSMADFGGVAGDPIVFDCLFVIKLD